MAYTLAQFITQAEAGGAIQITNALDTPGARAQVIVEIGGKNVTLNPVLKTKDVDGNLNIDPITASESDNSSLDLGTQFTAVEVLASRSLRIAISDGTVEAVAGTIVLSSIPTV